MTGRTAMAEKMLVSAFTGTINSVLGKLATFMGEEYAKLKDVRKQVAFLHEELGSMGALLEDLADMEELDNLTKEWRSRVREMSYDIEDCLDDFVHRVGGPHVGTGLMHRLKALRANHQLSTRIQELKARVQEASARRMRYKLDGCMSRSGNVVVDPRVSALYGETSSLVGIDGPKEDLINLLTKVDDASIQDLRVVSIVGFGGVGKTTLANEVYRTLGEHFCCKAFISVSQRPNMISLFKSLLSKVSGQEITHTSELPDLMESLRKYLHNKRYLIVVDDLWDSLPWENIKCAFPEGHCGSRVLVTTRVEIVAVISCNYLRKFVYRMKPLNDQDSKKLFFLRVFGSGNACPQPYEEPANEILRKCGGLPLAIISIAILLASQPARSVGQWNHVHNYLLANLASNPTLEGMRKILILSYNHLPRHLRTCLLYIGLYPEDCPIIKDRLIMQWVAEGFITGFDGRAAVEVAESYLNELVNRNMIIQLDDDYDFPIFYKVHDMILEVVLLKSTEENFLCDRKPKGNSQQIATQGSPTVPAV